MLTSRSKRAYAEVLQHPPTNADHQPLRQTLPIGKYPQPFVKWAGGKSQIISQMQGFFPRHFDRYIEPFLGGGAVFFHLRPNEATISDANFELMNAYKMIQNHLVPLVRELRDVQNETISEQLYDHYRSMDPEKLSPIRRAVRFIFLNKTCYNGLYRVNSQGEFNVPFGKYQRMPTLYEEENLIEVQKLLKNKQIFCASYEIGLDWASAGDFVYLDPPYASEPGSNGFTSYTKESFSETDQNRLATKFKELDKKGCLLMLSNSDIPLVHRLYPNYAKFRAKAGRMINCIGTERTGYKELLIMNYKLPSDTTDTLMPWVYKDS